MKLALINIYGEELSQISTGFVHLEPELLISDAHNSIDMGNSMFLNNLSYRLSRADCSHADAD